MAAALPVVGNGSPVADAPPPEASTDVDAAAMVGIGGLATPNCEAGAKAESLPLNRGSAADPYPGSGADP